MKNGALVTAYLDECAYIDTLKGDADAWCARLVEGPHDALGRACLDDGWTMAELDAAFTRRFGVKVNRGEIGA